MGNGDGTFYQKSTPGVGASAVAVGDFNGDGIADLAETSGNAVTVLMGNGDGTFTTKSTSNGGMYPRYVAVADFNGDGILDLVTANWSDSSVTVLLGNGDGTFNTKSTIDVGNSPDSVVVGDFNGDGIPDFATADYGSLTLTVLLGNCDGTFQTKSSASVPASPVSVAAGDFNGDGILDLATGTCNFNCGYFGVTGGFTVAFGKGDGTFPTQKSVGLSVPVYSIAAGDFTGDGIPDLVTSNTAYVTILLNQIVTETATANLSNVSVSGAETHQVAASYAGDTNYVSNFSSAIPILTAKIPTTLTLTSGLNPAIYDQDGFLLTATLSPYTFDGFSTDGEIVTFYNGSTVFGTGTLSSGVASIYVETGVRQLPVGTDVLTATYPGDHNYATATSNLVNQVIEAMAATPVIRPPGYAYPGPLTVSITDATPGAIIYYAINSVVTTSSPIYSGPFTINPVSGSIITVQAIATAPGYGQSAGASASYSYEPQVAQPLIMPSSGTYTSAQSVTITNTTPGVTIYYTTDGTTPSRSSAVFSGTPITVSSSRTIKALAVASGYSTSPEGVAAYNIIPPYAATPAFNLAPGFFRTPQTVAISDGTPGAKIYYTTDRSTPTTSSTPYTGPISINTTTQLKAIAAAANYSTSAIAIGNYYVAATEPIISPPSGRYSGPQMVTITSTTPGAIIYYTTDGTTPSWHSSVFNSASPISVISSQTIKALATAPGYTTSPEGVSILTITP